MYITNGTALEILQVSYVKCIYEYSTFDEIQHIPTLGFVSILKYFPKELSITFEKGDI